MADVLNRSRYYDDGTGSFHEKAAKKKAKEAAKAQ